MEHFLPTRISRCQLSLHGLILFYLFVLYLLAAFIFWGSLTVKLNPFQWDAFAILPPQASSRSRSKDLARKEVKKNLFWQISIACDHTTSLEGHTTSCLGLKRIRKPDNIQNEVERHCRSPSSRVSVENKGRGVRSMENVSKISIFHFNFPFPWGKTVC